MKTLKHLIFLTIICSLPVSCVKEKLAPTPEEPTMESRKLTLTATLPTLTKTSLQNGSEVYWSVADKIAVLCGNNMPTTGGVISAFTSTNTTPSKTADFVGYVTVPSNVENNQLSLYGVYPYSSYFSLDEDVLSIPLVSEQPAVAGTFAEDLSIAVGKSTGTSMTFYNVCGLLEFTLTRDDVKRVTIQGRNGEDLAGRLSVSFGTDGIPVVSSVPGDIKSVSVTAADNSYLGKNVPYYFVLAPTELQQGVRLYFETDEGIISRSIESPLEIKRSVASVLNDADTGALPGTLSFSDANFKAYCIENFDTDNDGEISPEEAQAVTSMACYDRGINSLAGIQYFTQLTSLNCSKNHLKTLDLSQNTLLTSLYVDDNNLSSLDVTNNPDLTYLSCSENSLTSLDLSGNHALLQLYASNNQLSALDLSQNMSLSVLSVNSNQLSALDVSENTALTSLSCGSNLLSSLVLASNTALVFLNIENNQIPSLDLSNNGSLVTVSVSSNLLSSLNLANNTDLEILVCASCQLSSLGLAHCEKLNTLICAANQLETLDVTHNVVLTSLTCDENQLTSLDVSHNTALNNLSCSKNQLTSLDVSSNGALSYLYCTDNPMQYIYVSLGQTFESQIPEGAQIVQPGNNSTEDYIREEW